MVEFCYGLLYSNTRPERSGRLFHWRGVRVVEGDRLEICCTARYLGFESLPLRHNAIRLSPV